jgi:hypothetical protein
MPAGEFTPDSPALEPSLDGAVVEDGFCIELLLLLSYVSCAKAPTEPIAAKAIAAVAAFKTLIWVSFRVDAPGRKTPGSGAWFLKNSCSATPVRSPAQAEPAVNSHVGKGKSVFRTINMKTESVTLTKQELSEAIVSPVSVFDFPLEVVACPGLSRDQKIEILKRWELDARALQRATDENMSGGEPPMLEEVNRAMMLLDPLNAVPDAFGAAPTKI